LIDQDTSTRDVFSGQKQTVGHAPYSGWVGYVHFRAPQKGLRSSFCGLETGEIHISFDHFLNYSLNTNACIIIHEAAHKYLGMRGDIYGDNAAYPPGLEETGGSLDNCDSLSWTAVSLATGAVRMQTPASTDFESCPGGPL
jgi:hypothetical protein